jgi:hypothetical protein
MSRAAIRYCRRLAVSGALTWDSHKALWGLCTGRERCTPATDHGPAIRQRPLCGSDTDHRLTGEISMGRQHYRTEAGWVVPWFA